MPARVRSEEEEGKGVEDARTFQIDTQTKRRQTDRQIMFVTPPRTERRSSAHHAVLLVLVDPLVARPQHQLVHAKPCITAECRERKECNI